MSKPTAEDDWVLMNDKEHPAAPPAVLQPIAVPVASGPGSYAAPGATDALYPALDPSYMPSQVMGTPTNSVMVDPAYVRLIFLRPAISPMVFHFTRRAFPPRRHSSMNNNII